MKQNDILIKDIIEELDPTFKCTHCGEITLKEKGQSKTIPVSLKGKITIHHVCIKCSFVVLKETMPISIYDGYVLTLAEIYHKEWTAKHNGHQKRR